MLVLSRPDSGAQLVGAAMPQIDGCMGCSISSPGALFGLGQDASQLEATANGIIEEANGAFFVSRTSVGNAMALLTKAEAKQLGQILIGKGVDASTVEAGYRQAFPTQRSAIYGVIATASAAASAYHGYKRNQSIGWALWWGFCGGLFPILTPVLAVAQGYGKAK
jgi:hypothetical protein